MSDLRSRLEMSLSGTYTLERELGGGGMSRVFVAEEMALGRKVVVKVLSPELAEGLSGARFVREIKVAARLQQANVVPLLRAGELDGLPYYTMPFVTGESLRARMQNGRLPAAEAIAILEDVAKALAYAHAEGVVHRDIKPENVLLSAGTAVVTDFGIAKAISAARGADRSEDDRPNELSATSLTSIGTSIGTPAYMAPEQAAGDPDADARVDIYAWGVIAYELLAGRHPFAHHTSTHGLIRAHMAEAPEHLGVFAPEAPAALNAVVMMCLAKSPDDRPPSANDLLAALRGAHFNQHGRADVIRKPLSAGKALVVYAIVFAVVAGLAKASLTMIGLPNWVFAGSIGVMLLGLPVVLLTALVERQRAAHAAPTPSGMSTLTRLAVQHPRRFTWRRTRLGGAMALGFFIVAVGAYMAMRHFGVGPLGSLIGSKALAADDRILLADLRGPAADTSLGAVFAEGMRAALSESKAVHFVPPERASAVLGQMQQRAAPIVGPVARELAERVGAKAILDGDVRSVGKSYTLTIRLLSLGDGDPLAILQETAKDDADFTPATGRLATRLRERIGESLKSVNSAPKLADVTTASLPALRKYTDAVRARERGDYPTAMALSQEAVGIDSGFAMAYRFMGTLNSSGTARRESQVRWLKQAFDHRARATESERLMIEVSYWRGGPTVDVTKADEATHRLASIDSSAYALILSQAAYDVRDFTRAVSMAHLAVTRDSSITSLSALMNAEAALGRLDSARWVLDRMRAIDPAHPITRLDQILLAMSAGDDSTALGIAHGMEAAGNSAVASAYGVAAEWAELEHAGRLKEGRAAHVRHIERTAAVSVLSVGTIADVLFWEARLRARFAGDSAYAVALLDSSLKFNPWAGEDRAFSYSDYIQAAVEAHRPDLARGVLERLRRDDPGAPLFAGGTALPVLEGLVLRSEGKYDEAIASLRRGKLGGTPKLSLALLGQTFDAAGQKDSARVYYERYVNSTALLLAPWINCQFDAPIRVALGKLYEERGEFDKASQVYEQFVNQWRHADADLQPQVRAVRARMARLESRRAK
ncbi:MAG: protein kinase [Gemmatimonadetes bacterium]|nr:protein kinase [Gemmatimonadota bacterium]